MAYNNTHTDILIAGALAAFSIDLLVYPLDTIKTRIQAPEYARVYKRANGTIHRALFRGLYQGVGSVILATVPSAGAFFTTYEASKAALHRLNARVLSPSTQIPVPVLNSLASCAGELVSCVILTPAEVLKQNAQVLRRSGSSSEGVRDRSATRTALSPFIKRPGLLFHGYAALVARNLPFTGLHFPLFEALRARINAERAARGLQRGTLREKALVTAVSAGSAGSVAAFITTPVDVVKTRIMLRAGRQGAGGEEAARATSREGTAGSRSSKDQSSGWRVGRDIWRAEGLRGLFRGAALRGGWTAIGSGLYLGIYESGRAWLEDRRKQKEEGE